MTTPLSYIVFPGRHHLLTRFQADYLGDLLSGGLTDSAGATMTFADDATIVWR